MRPVVLLAATALAAFTASADDREGKASNDCPVDGDVQCGQHLPDNFCCHKGFKCHALASNTTAICCPNGGDCRVIAPVPCDATLFDPELQPNNTIRSVALRSELLACASGCCPFGYFCTPENKCAKEASQDRFWGLIPEEWLSTAWIPDTSSILAEMSSRRNSQADATSTAATATPDGGGDAGIDPNAQASPTDTTTTTTDSAGSGDSEGGAKLPPGAIAAIAVGVVGLVSGLIAIAYFFFMAGKRKTKRREAAAAESLAASGAAPGTSPSKPADSSPQTSSISPQCLSSSPSPNAGVYPHPQPGYYAATNAGSPAGYGPENGHYVEKDAPPVVHEAGGLERCELPNSSVNELPASPTKGSTTPTPKP